MQSASKFNHMVDYRNTTAALTEGRLDAVFHALGDRTRRDMLRSLAQGERTVGQLAEPFQMSLAAASKHIKALEGAGLIRREVQGRVHLCRLDASPLGTACDWLRHYEQFWTTRLDRLEALLRQEQAAAAPAPQKSPRRAAPAGSRTSPPEPPSHPPLRRKANRSTR